MTKMSFVHLDNTVFSTKKHDVSGVSSCNHKEVDTRAFLHAKDLALRGISKVKTHTIDTDILVIATAHFSSLGVDEFWVDFGTGKDREFYPVHELYKKMGEEKAKSLLFFHAFTSCGQVSFFAYCGKKNACNTCHNSSEVTEVFFKLSQTPSN